MDLYTEDAFEHTDCSRELKPGERFLGNQNIRQEPDIPDYLKHLKTIRLGEQAYDLNKNPIERDYCRPLIVHQSEYDAYNNIMQARLEASRRG